MPKPLCRRDWSIGGRWEMTMLMLVMMMVVAVSLLPLYFKQPREVYANKILCIIWVRKPFHPRFKWFDLKMLKAPPRCCTGATSATSASATTSTTSTACCEPQPISATSTCGASGTNQGGQEVLGDFLQNP